MKDIRTGSGVHVVADESAPKFGLHPDLPTVEEVVKVAAHETSTDDIAAIEDATEATSEEEAVQLTTDGVQEKSRYKLTGTLSIVELADGRTVAVSDSNHVLYTETPIIFGQHTNPTLILKLPVRAYTFNLSSDEDLKKYNELLGGCLPDNPKIFMSERIEFHKGSFYAFLQVQKILYRKNIPPTKAKK